MPYKNKKDLYEAQKRYRTRKKIESNNLEKRHNQLYHENIQLRTKNITLNLENIQLKKQLGANKQEEKGSRYE